ncbi:hypothetical protein GE061_019877 [Apolygus lucorum]|uniref:Uncharacterized protein n=1 Tax=Apolygus lucorum TaxID=248454 RepID=A0A8S9XAZ5_APOLU|nr:hypothetical protein GE061_019877 [Apolygus lucorum]
MMSRDSEGQQLEGICDNISAVFQRLQNGLEESSRNVVKYGVSFYNQRKLEVAKYKEKYINDMKAIIHQSTVVIREFITSKTNLLRTLLSLYKEENANEETAAERLKQSVICDKDFTLSRRKAWWDLMEQELLRHDMNEKNLTIFEDRLIEQGKTFSEKIQVEFLSMRNLEDEFFIALSDQVNQYLVEIHMSQEPALIAEHFKALLLHKEKREKIIGQSHKNHLSEIEMEEEKLLNQVKGWQTSLVKTFCHAEIERNRRAIIEISRFISHHKKDWSFQTEKAMSNAYSFMKSIDPTWTHELIRIKMNSKERMMDDQMEAMFRERFLATAMRKRIEVQVKEEQGDASAAQTELEKEEKRELDVRVKRKAYRFAYAALLRRDTQMESIYQAWNSAEDIPAHCEIDTLEPDESKTAVGE